jgi:hypothetical protein
MSLNDINIEPLNIICNRVRIESVSLTLFESAQISVSLYNDSELISFRNFVILGTDYTSWENDDSYLVNWIMQQLGATITQNED